MSISAKPGGLRFTRRWLEPEVPPVLRRGREDRIVRWIGAAGRRAPKPVDAAEARRVAEASETRVIRLSWAETFGRPARPDPDSVRPSALGGGRVLTFQNRPSDAAPRQPTPRRAAVQPSVPVLR